MRRYVYRGIFGVVGLVFAWWEGLHPWPSDPAHVSILTAIIVMFVLAILVGRRHQRMSSRAWLSRTWASIRRPTQRPPLYLFGTVVWVMLVLAVAGWDFRSFLLELHSLPTLSYLIGRVSRFATGRSILVAAWLALGAFFVAGNRVHLAPKGGRTSSPPRDAADREQLP
ncbi:hypothetical protein [Ferrimicrobium sp.]|uniref:hypothetical protein n=1 Tax=Ferrimicrobium sp. TaxID=2926050 RepID=UPI00262D8184|nr:hypothetical protein [Ferrimicrobium sp.]